MTERPPRPVLMSPGESEAQLARARNITPASRERVEAATAEPLESTTSAVEQPPEPPAAEAPASPGAEAAAVLPEPPPSPAEALLEAPEAVRENPLGPEDAFFESFFNKREEDLSEVEAWIAARRVSIETGDVVRGSKKTKALNSLDKLQTVLSYLRKLGKDEPVVRSERTKAKRALKYLREAGVIDLLGVGGVDETGEEVPVPDNLPIEPDGSEAAGMLESIEHGEFEISFAESTLASEDHSERNEDAHFSSPSSNTMGLFDGMGGHAAGEVASHMVNEHVREQIELLDLKDMEPEQVAAEMKRILTESNRQILEAAEADSTKEGMGATASIAHIWERDGQTKLVVGNIGDSRVYVFRNGRLEQITLDDSKVFGDVLRDEGERAAREMQERWNEAEDPSTLPGLEPVLFSNYRNIITQSLGGDSIEVRTHIVDLQAGDRILICSDGVSDNLTTREIEDILSRRGAIDATSNELTRAAQDRSRDASHPRHKADDMTVCVVEVGHSEAASLQEPSEALGEQPDNAGPTRPPLFSSFLEQRGEEAFDKRSREFEEAFHMNRQDLESVAGYSELSEGQKALIQERLQQIILGKVKEEARAERKDQQAAAGKFKRLFGEITKQYHLAKLEKASATKLLEGGIDMHRGLLEQLVAGVGLSKDEVQLSAKGDVEILYAAGLTPESFEEKQIIDRFNQAASEMSRIPSEWSADIATSGERRKSSKAEANFRKARAEIIALKQEKGAGQQDIAEWMNNVDANVRLDQFITTHPQAVDRLESVADAWVWRRALTTMVTEQGLYFAGGFVARTITSSLIGAFATPLVSGALGGWRGRERAKETIRERAVLARRGMKDESETAQNLIDIDRNRTVTKLTKLTEQLASANDPEDRAKLRDRLKERTHYIQEKISEGKISFGDSAVRLKNQIDLVQALSQASIALVGYKQGEYGEKLAVRVDELVSKHDVAVEGAQEDMVRAAMLRGIAMGAASGLAGYVFRHFAGDMFGWSEHHETKAPDLSESPADPLESKELLKDQQILFETGVIHKVGVEGAKLSDIIRKDYTAHINGDIKGPAREYVVEIIRRRADAMNPEQLRALGISSGDVDVLHEGDAVNLGKILYGDRATLERAYEGAMRLTPEDLKKIDQEGIEKFLDAQGTAEPAASSAELPNVSQGSTDPVVAPNGTEVVPGNNATLPEAAAETAPVEAAPTPETLTNVIAIGKRGPEGSIIDYFTQHEDVAKQFGWDGTGNVKEWAGKKAHTLWLAHASKALETDEVKASLTKLGYTTDLEGYSKMMTRIKSGGVTLDLEHKGVTLADMEYLKAKASSIPADLDIPETGETTDAVAPIHEVSLENPISHTPEPIGEAINEAAVGESTTDHVPGIPFDRGSDPELDTIERGIPFDRDSEPELDTTEVRGIPFDRNPESFLDTSTMSLSEAVAAHMNHDLSEVFGTTDEAHSEWPQWRNYGARRFLNLRVDPESGHAVALQRYIHGLESHLQRLHLRIRPRGGILFPNESVQDYIRRALQLIEQRSRAQ